MGYYNESSSSGFGYTYDQTTGNLASKAGLSYTYGDPSHTRVVTTLSNSYSYQYDANGNMTRRNLGIDVFNLAYDQENHLVQVSGTVTATYGYDRDGKRVLSTEGITTMVYIGNYFEMSVSGGVTNTMTYYYAGTERVAMRQNEGAVKWLLGDHLGSTSLVYDGSETIRQGYKAWGERRFILGGEELHTPFRYTGQREEASIGLYYYGARWYDPYLSRWIQPDSIVPEVTQGVQAWDRYSYVNNSPVNYNDPSGHCLVLCTAIIGGAVGAIAGAVGYTAYTAASGTEFKVGDMLLAVGGGAIVGAVIGS